MAKETWILLVCCFVVSLEAFPPLPTTSSLVVSSTTEANKDAIKETNVSCEQFLQNIFLI